MGNTKVAVANIVMNIAYWRLPTAHWIRNVKS